MRGNIDPIVREGSSLAIYVMLSKSVIKKKKTKRIVTMPAQCAVSTVHCAESPKPLKMGWQFKELLEQERPARINSDIKAGISLELIK